MTPGQVDSSSATRTDRRRLARRVFFATYLAIQLLVPILGLWVARGVGHGLPFCWHMYAFMPRDPDGE